VAAGSKEGIEESKRAVEHQARAVEKKERQVGQRRKRRTAMESMRLRRHPWIRRPER
jgi:hypothetical protein